MLIATEMRALSLRYRFLNFRTVFHSLRPPIIEKVEIGPQIGSLEMGVDGEQSSVLCQIGGTKVQSSIMLHDQKDKFLKVNFQETSGKIRSQGFTVQEIISSRLIDRAIRPLFTAGFPTSINVTCALKSNLKHDADLVAILATSANLMVSNIPWDGPLGVIRMGRINGNFIIYPTKEEQCLSDINLVYACTHEKTVMIDLEAHEIADSDLANCLKLAHKEAIKCIDSQVKLSKHCGKKKDCERLVAISQNLQDQIESSTFSRFRSIFAEHTGNKYERASALNQVMKNAWTSEMQVAMKRDQFAAVCNLIKKKALCSVVMSEGIRFDRRSLHEVRLVTCKSGYLPGLHGSALLSRGETQVLCTVTIGASGYAENSFDVVIPKKRFRVDYDFPSFCKNLITGYTTLSKREIGHGMLVEKALLSVFPSGKDFPYIVHLDAKVMSSDGSSSMASVCAGSMALMDAGVPLQCHVAGVSIGLIIDDTTSKGQFNYCIITDLLGLEDSMGEMDFKIAGTRTGITAIQLDVKPAGISLDIICEALKYGCLARLQILDHMEREIECPKEIAHGTSTFMYGSCSSIKPMLFMKRKIEDETGARLYAGDDRVIITSKDESMAKKTAKKIDDISCDAEVGKLYDCTVKSVLEEGAVVEYNGGRHGLLHISELSTEEVPKVSDLLSVGDNITVKCIKKSFSGIIHFSLKAVT